MPKLSGSKEEFFAARLGAGSRNLAMYAAGTYISISGMTLIAALSDE
jgi:hypothetical protein